MVRCPKAHLSSKHARLSRGYLQRRAGFSTDVPFCCQSRGPTHQHAWCCSVLEVIFCALGLQPDCLSCVQQLRGLRGSPKLFAILIGFSEGSLLCLPRMHNACKSGVAVPRVLSPSRAVDIQLLNWRCALSDTDAP